MSYFGNYFGTASGGLFIPASGHQDPIDEQIIQNVVSTIGIVTVTNGFANTITSVERPNPGIGNVGKNLAAVVYQGNPEPIEDSIQTGREWMHPINILITVVESEGSSTPIDQRINSIRADVEKALMADITRGGLAIDTLVRAPQLGDILITAHQGEVTVVVDVQYRTLWNDPYTLQ